MREPWSSRLAVLAVVAAAQAYVAPAANAADAGAALANIILERRTIPLAIPLTGIAERGTQAWMQFTHWISQGYAHAPALMLGLSILLAVPVLALAGVLTSRNRRSSNRTVMLPRRKRRADRAQLRTQQTDVSPWPTEAWVEAEGYPGSRRVIGRTLIRIGREEDNDLRFAVKTVHRYHAVIRRTTDGVVMITDLSGKDGNGVLVNGARVAEARLAKGDVINIGEVKMRFEASPA
jgi:FHA domain